MTDQTEIDEFPLDILRASEHYDIFDKRSIRKRESGFIGTYWEDLWWVEKSPDQMALIEARKKEKEVVGVY